MPTQNPQQTNDQQSLTRPLETEGTITNTTNPYTIGTIDLTRYTDNIELSAFFNPRPVRIVKDSNQKLSSFSNYLFLKNLKDAFVLKYNRAVQVVIKEESLEIYEVYNGKVSNKPTETISFTECEKIEDKYIPKKYDFLAEDYETGNKDFKHRMTLCYSVSDKFSKILGHKRLKKVYSSTPEYNTTVYFEKIVHKRIVDRVNTLKLGFIEDYNNGWFFQTEKLRKKFSENLNPEGYEAGIKNLTEDRMTNIKFGMDSITYLITEGKRNSFGVELETSNGYFPRNLYKYLNVKAVRDGSVTGRLKEIYK